MNETKLTLADKNSSITITAKGSGFSLDDMLNEFIKPALLAYGYPAALVQEALEEDIELIETVKKLSDWRDNILQIYPDIDLDIEKLI